MDLVRSSGDSVPKCSSPLEISSSFFSWVDLLALARFLDFAFDFRFRSDGTDLERDLVELGLSELGLSFLRSFEDSALG